MPTSSPSKRFVFVPPPRVLRPRLLSLIPYPLSLAFALLTFSVPISASAQTLARPGWAGSGLSAETWWHNAVVYRIVTSGFQDSDADSIGDLRGIADRMDYLQSLGVDAILLDNPLLKPNTDAGFDDVITAATQRRIRVLVTLEDSTDTTQTDLAAQARMWLTRGAAGIFLHSPRPATSVAPLLRSLRTLTDSFPGNRILVAETATNPAPGSIHPINLDFDAPPPPPRGKPGTTSGAQLTAAPLELTNATAITLRAALNGANDAPPGTTPLLTEQIMLTPSATAEPAQIRDRLEGRRRAFALLLLASRGAASLRYGQEIGMSPLLPSAEPTRVMQWTPSNITHPAPPPPQPEATAAAATPAPPPPSDVYGEFKPYVPPPLPKPVKAAAPAAPATGLAPPPVDPDTFAGFTTGKLPPPAPGDLSPADATTLNVAREYPDPASLLNLYRRLIELRQDYPTLRNGSETVLDYDDLGAVVWIRQPPRGSTAAAVIAICNLSATPLHLSLNPELTRQHLHPGSIRNLLATTASQDNVQNSASLTLPAYGVFLGELYH